MKWTLILWLLILGRNLKDCSVGEGTALIRSPEARAKTVANKLLSMGIKKEVVEAGLPVAKTQPFINYSVHKEGLSWTEWRGQDGRVYRTDELLAAGRAARRASSSGLQLQQQGVLQGPQEARPFTPIHEDTPVVSRVDGKNE